MKKLWKYMRDYRREGILAPLFKLLEASLELLVPLVMAQIIDTGIANGGRRLYTFALRNTCSAGGGRSGVLHNGAVFCG